MIKDKNENILTKFEQKIKKTCNEHQKLFLREHI